MNRYTRLPRPLVLIFMIAAILVLAAPALAAPGGTLVSYQLNAAECFVDISAQVTDAGFYVINIWDDGAFRAGAGDNVPAGGTLTVRITIGGLILQGAAGIGVYLENAVGTAATTTYNSNGSAQLWSDQVGTDCVNSGHTFGAVLVPQSGPRPPPSIPAGFVLRTIICDTPVYNQAAGTPVEGAKITLGQTWYVSPTYVYGSDGRNWSEIFAGGYTNGWIETRCIG